MPLRPLLLLMAAVLAAHWWILGPAQAPVRVREPLAVPATFVTRSIPASTRDDVAPPTPVEIAAELEPVRVKAAVPAPKRARQPEPAVITTPVAEPLRGG